MDPQSSAQRLFPAQQALPPPRPESRQGLVPWLVEKAFDIAVLVVALVNLALVFFDYSYLMLRPQYQRYAPAVVSFYDPYKGIDPYRSVQDYLTSARQTLAAAEADPAASTTAAAYARLKDASRDLIRDEDAFSISNQRGVLERIKHTASAHMIGHSGEAAIQRLVMVTDKGNHAVRPATDARETAREFTEHSTLALQLFFTPENLNGRAAQESAWFEARLAPLLNRAYYRHYGEDGKPIERFWRVDCAFALFFLAELLLRAVWVLLVAGHDGRPFGTRFKAFLASRWMDLLYFVPLVLYLPIINDLIPAFIRESIQFVRMFSVGFRMQRLGLINPVQVVQAKVAEVLDLVTDLVNVKLLSNYQESVRQLNLEEAMHSLTPQQRQQLTALIQGNLTMVLEDVLPDVAPSLERLIMRAAQQALEQAPAYQQLRRLPFFGALPERLLPSLIAQVIAGTQVTMLKAINDGENVKLTNQIIDAVTDSLIKHMAEIGTEAELKRLLVDLLEEQKRKVLAK